MTEAPGADDGSGDPDAPAERPVGLAMREGELVRLRAHVPANRAAFQRWYADPEVARLLRHDQEPLGAAQSRAYFDTFILPLSARGLCYAIHEAVTDRLIGTTALTDVTDRGPDGRSALFRIVIGEQDVWGRGYGTEATRLVMDEAFGTHDLSEVRLEVFRHNPRALAAYRRVGFRVTGEHTEWVGRQRTELQVVEMALRRDEYGRAEPALVPVAAARPAAEGTSGPAPDREQRRQERQQRREERQQNPERPERAEKPSPQEREERRQRREERQQRRGQREEREERREERRQRQAGDEIDPSPS